MILFWVNYVFSIVHLYWSWLIGCWNNKIKIKINWNKIIIILNKIYCHPNIPALTCLHYLGVRGLSSVCLCNNYDNNYQIVCCEHSQPTSCLNKDIFFFNLFFISWTVFMKPALILSKSQESCLLATFEQLSVDFISIFPLFMVLF